MDRGNAKRTSDEREARGDAQKGKGKNGESERERAGEAFLVDPSPWVPPH